MNCCNHISILTEFIGSSRFVSKNNFKAMKMDETRNFKIDKKKNTKCRLPNDKIKIKKEEVNEYVYSFTMVENDADAFVVCHAGLVTELSVSDDAKQCGIGTMLMQLCFNEKKLHNVADNDNNVALSLINEYSASNVMSIAKDIEEWVDSKCKKILKLTMAASPASAARVYFKSALASGFTEMFIALDSEFYPKEGPCSVGELEKRYTADGYMQDKEGHNGHNDKVKVFGEYWFFCKPKTPTLHNKCTIL